MGGSCTKDKTIKESIYVNEIAIGGKEKKEETKEVKEIKEEV